MDDDGYCALASDISSMVLKLSRGKLDVTGECLIVVSCSFSSSSIDASHSVLMGGGR